MKVYQEETIPVCGPDQSESGSAGSTDPHWKGRVVTGGWGCPWIYIKTPSSSENQICNAHMYKK